MISATFPLLLPQLRNAALCTEYAALRDTAWDVNFQFLRSDAHFMIYGKDDPSQAES